MGEEGTGVGAHVKSSAVSGVPEGKICSQHGVPSPLVPKSVISLESTSVGISPHKLFL